KTHEPPPAAVDSRDQARWFSDRGSQEWRTGEASGILIAYRHALRASELCELTWNMMNAMNAFMSDIANPRVRVMTLPAVEAHWRLPGYEGPTARVPFYVHRQYSAKPATAGQRGRT